MTNKIKPPILKRIVIASMTSKNVQRATRQFAEIEQMFAAHGGDTNVLLKKAKDLARTTTMSFKEAAHKVIWEDRKIKLKKKGICLGHYGFVLKEYETIKKCPKCGNQLNIFFSDKETEYNYECSEENGGCGWISEIKRNYESEYAKKLRLYEKGERK